MLPEQWQATTLRAAISRIDAGTSVNSEDRRANDGEIAVLKTGAAFGGRFLAEKHKVVVASDIGRVSCPVRGGTILLSRMNTKELVGENGYVDKDYPHLFLPDRLWALTGSEVVVTRWLGHLLASPMMREQLGLRGTGTSGSMKNISQDALLGIPLMLPPLPEQRRIAAVLDAWDAAIATAERLVASKRARYRAILAKVIDPLLAGQQMVREMFDSVGSGAWGEEGEPGLRILRNTDFGKNGFLALDNAPVRQLSARDAHRTRLMSGDLVLEKSGGGPDQPVGRVSRFAGAEGYSFSNFLLRLSPRPDMASSFCYFVLERMYQRGDPLYFQQQTTGIRNLEWQDYLDSSVTIPDLDRQLQLVGVLTDAERSCHLAERQVTLLRHQKRGLMQFLLTGELRVPESIDRLLSATALASAA